MKNDWTDQWAEDTTGKPRRGGQGAVTRVVSKLDGHVGALKKMHSDLQKVSERRFRMQQEVNVMRVLSGGVPQVYDSNADKWEDKSVSLYVVMEWIEGPTLAERVGNEPLSIDETLTFTSRLLDITDGFNSLGVVHRDLKPDNVILRSGDSESPVVVDFGLAWHQVDDETNAFKTPIGQEVGNRFLRLPEHAPGRVSRDYRSDLTVVAGLMFFAVSGIVPRVLRDENNRAAHDAAGDRIPENIRADPRWQRLRRVFNRAFQPDIELRFQSAAELRKALDNLEPTVEQANPVDAALERLRTVVENDRFRELEALQNRVQEDSRRFAEKCSRIGGEASFGMPGSHGYDEDGRTYRVAFGLQRKGMSGGTPVHYYHQVQILDRELVARYRISGTGDWTEYYRGSIADPDGLAEAMDAQAPIVMAELISYYADLIERHAEPH